MGILQLQEYYLLIMIKKFISLIGKELFNMLKYLSFYVIRIVGSYIRHVKLLALITIFAYGFSSSVYAGYWIDYASTTQGWPSSNYATFLQGAKTVPFSAKVLGGGTPNIIDKGSMYTGNSAFGTTVQFSLFRYNNSTAILALNGSGVLTTSVSSTGKCYFIPSFYASYYTENSTSVYSHSSNKAANTVGVYYAPEQSVIINKNCNEIKGDDPEINQLTIPADVPEYYIAWGTPIKWTSGDRNNNWSIIEYGYMSVFNLTSKYNFAPQYNIFICPTNTIDSRCVRTSQTGTGGSNDGDGEVIVPATCNLSGNNDGLDFGTVSNDDYIGKTATYQLDASCSKDTAVKFSIISMDDIKLGPFKVKVNINNEESPTVNIGTNIKTLNINGVLESAIEMVKPGSYESSLVILSEQQ